MTRIYLAASYARKNEMRGIRDVLDTAGYIITSRWIDQDGEYKKGVVSSDLYQEDPRIGYKFAQRDVIDISEADVFMMFTGDGLSSGGRHTEFGLASVAPNIKAIIVIGPRENVFQCHPGIIQFPNWDQFCLHLWNGLAIAQAEFIVRSEADSLDE